MSLGSDLAPHLPFLRRYARALTGSQAHGDAFVRATLEAIASSVDSFPRDVDPRLGLYRTFHAIWSSTDIEEEPDDAASINAEEKIAQSRLSRITPSSRQALLLTAMEGFTPDDVGYLLGTSSSEVERLVAEALAEIERQTRADVLIIEDEPIIAMDIETIVRDLGHRVTGVAVTRTEALAKAIEHPPGLVLADIQLADDSSGIDAVRDILARMRVPVIFVTAFPERLLTGDRPEPTFLITKPFQRSTVKMAIAQALFFDEATVPIATDLPQEAENPVPGPALFATSKPAVTVDSPFHSRPGPINAEVVDGQLQLSATPPRSPTPGPDLEAIRKLHFATAKRLALALSGSNIGPSINARLEAIRKSLSRRLSEETVLHLAIQSQGLGNMKPLLHERLDDATAMDVITFVDDLANFAKQFPAYREFLREAQSFEEITANDRQTMVEISSAFESQPDEIVEAALKEAIAETISNLQDNADPTAAFALLRSLGNLLRAIARSFVGVLAELSGEASTAFKKGGGRILGWSGALVLFGVPVYQGLTFLAARFPNEFGFVLDLIKVLKEMAL